MLKTLMILALLTLVSISCVTAQVDIPVSGTIPQILVVNIMGTTPVLGDSTPNGYIMTPGHTYYGASNIQVDSNGKYMVQVSTPMPTGASLLGHMYAVKTPSIQLTQGMTCVMNSHASFPLSAPIDQLFTGPYWVGHGDRKSVV